MQKWEALEILQALANGIDPYTGEVLPDDSSYQHPSTIRALFFAIRVLEQIDQNDTREKVRITNVEKSELANAGKAWSRTEDEQLIKEFDTGMLIRDLALKHQRTRGAIQSRLIKLGKITAVPHGELTN